MVRRLQEEALCLELGNRSSLAYCYWAWSLLARAERDRKTEREKLAAALDIFTELVGSIDPKVIIYRAVLRSGLKWRL